MKPKSSKPKVGDWVEVRSKEEILRRLDPHGQLDGMPFMPEMLAFCGKRFQVYKRAHKTCDTVFPIRGRRVDDAVHLDTRCDGSAHGGCQAGCLIFWKMAWLKPTGDGATDLDPAEAGNGSPAASQCTEADVRAMSQRVDQGETIYRCQATQLPYATRDLNWWDLRQYLEDYTSGNVSFWRIFCGAVYSLYNAVIRAGIGVGPMMRWFYDKLYPLWRGTPFPGRAGRLPEGYSTPTIALKLEPGELVRVKSHEEILGTINNDSKNRGMLWGPEMVPYCGGVYRVLKRVTKIINEQTGAMQEMKTPCIILDSVVCQSRYSECRLFCPRSIYPYWREIWLERVVPGALGKQRGADSLLHPNEVL